MTRCKTAMPFLVMLLSAFLVNAETLTLSRDFVNRCRNSATITAQFELDAHLNSPHRIDRSGDDGDIHMAGRAPEIQLPMVAEIMNAGLPAQSDSVTMMNDTAPGSTIPVVGAWRIWFEHPSSGDQTQGDEIDPPTTSNPDHVFEIHPITNFGGHDIGNSSLLPIDKPNVDPSTRTEDEDYQAYPANAAFVAYEKLQATINATDTAVSITASKAGYNYTEFVMEPVGQSQLGDNGNGIFVLANVYDVSDADNPVTSSPRRMVFIQNTEPAKQLQRLPPGQRLHVLGIPRVNLAEVAAVSSGNSIDMPLPYEMIIVAVFSDNPAVPSNSADAGHTRSPQSHRTRRHGSAVSPQ